MVVVVMSPTKNQPFKIPDLAVTLLRRYYTNRRDYSAAACVATHQKYLRNSLFTSPAYNYNHTNGYNYIHSAGIRFMSENTRPIRDIKPRATGLHVVKDEGKKKVQTFSQKFGLFITWGKWFLSSAVAVWFSFSQKGQRLVQVLGGVKVEKVVEEVEEAAEVVNKVATATEKVCADVAEKVPLLKDEAVFIENVSTIAASDAQSTLHFLHKVEELKQDIQDLETMAEPLVDKIRHQEIDKP